MGFDTAHDQIGSLEDALGNVDRFVVAADRGLNDAELVIDAAELLLGNADQAVNVIEGGVAAGKRLLPKVAIGLAIVGVGVAVAVLIRRTREGRQAAEEYVVEQPEEMVDQMEAAEFAQDAADPEQKDAS